MSENVQSMIRELASTGLNHWGAVTPERYDKVAKPGLKTADLFADTQSILVFASGGRALWDAFIADLSRNPRHLDGEQHPLDAFVMRSVEAASMTLSGASHRWFFAAAEADVHLDFRTLAVMAGLGVPSRLGLVIDKEFGPWMGLRAACMLQIPIEETAAQEDLCAACASPCIPACPASALEGGQWSFETCASFHRSSDTCSTQCVARSSCPVGEGYRYSEAQTRYHYNRAIGRVELAQSLEIEDKIFEGLGPLWADWSG